MCEASALFREMRGLGEKMRGWEVNASRPHKAELARISTYFVVGEPQALPSLLHHGMLTHLVKASGRN